MAPVNSRFSPQLLSAKQLGLLLVLLLVLITPLAILISRYYTAGTVSNHSPVYNKAIRLIEASADELTKNGAASIIAYLGRTSNIQRYGNLSWPCTAALTAAGVVRSSDPQRAAKYVAYGTQIADWEIAHGRDNRYHRMGWGIYNNIYTYQDGAVGYCIANAYKQTKYPKYLAALTEEMNFFWPYFTTDVDPLCLNCGYWYDNPQNDEPFIKNMNMYMAQAVSKLYTLTGNIAYRDRSIQTFESELYEINIRHEFGYHGYDSTQGHAEDEHMGVEIWGFAGLAHFLNMTDSDYPMAINAIWNAWEKCGSKCNSGDYNIPLVNCSLAQDVTGARKACEQFILATESTESIQLIGAIESLPAWE